MRLWQHSGLCLSMSFSPALPTYALSVGWQETISYMTLREGAAGYRSSGFDSSQPISPLAQGHDKANEF